MNRRCLIYPNSDPKQADSAFPNNHALELNQNHNFNAPFKSANQIRFFSRVVSQDEEEERNKANILFFTKFQHNVLWLIFDFLFIEDLMSVASLNKKFNSLIPVYPHVHFRFFLKFGTYYIDLGEK